MADAGERRTRRALLAAILFALPSPRARAQDIMPMPRLRPPPRLETVPPSPGRSFEWVHGFWRWTGTRFTWIHGRYKARRPWSYRWIKGHFEGSDGNEKWVAGTYGRPKPSNR
jgi:hypothetical protein